MRFNRVWFYLLVMSVLILSFQNCGTEFSSSNFGEGSNQVSSTPNPTPEPTPEPTPNPTPSPSPQPSPITGETYVYPPDAQFTAASMPNRSMPAYLTSYKSVFGTTVTRIGDMAAMGASQSRVRHMYAKMQPWNSDGSLILLSYTSEAFILDGNTYKFKHKIPNGGLGNKVGPGVDGSCCSTAEDARWSNLQPNVIYSVDGAQFIKIDPNTGVRTTIRDFKSSFSGGIRLGYGEGNISDNDQYAALIGKDASGHYWLVSYNIAQNTVTAQKDLGTKAGSSYIDWVSASPSGKHIVVMWYTGGKTEVYDVNLNFQRTIAGYVNHADIGYDQSGKETLVMLYEDSKNNYIESFPLDGSARTRHLATNWAGDMHISCRNIKRPGWCYISDPNNSSGWYPANGHASLAGYNETFALKLDDSGTVEHFAHNYNSYTSNYNKDTMSTVDRYGYRVMFASDWMSGNSNGPFYSYVAGLINISPAP